MPSTYGARESVLIVSYARLLHPFQAHTYVLGVEIVLISPLAKRWEQIVSQTPTISLCRSVKKEKEQRYPVHIQPIACSQPHRCVPSFPQSVFPMWRACLFACLAQEQERCPKPTVVSLPQTRLKRRMATRDPAIGINFPLSSPFLFGIFPPRIRCP